MNKFFWMIFSTSLALILPTAMSQESGRLAVPPDAVLLSQLSGGMNSMQGKPAGQTLGQTPLSMPGQTTGASGVPTGSSSGSSVTTQTQVVSGKVRAVPRLIRDYPIPEVFFEGLPGRYRIPTTDDYNRIMNTLNAAYSHSPKMSVGVTIDGATSTITDIEAPKFPTTQGSLYDDLPLDQGSMNAAGTANNGGTQPQTTMNGYGTNPVNQQFQQQPQAPANPYASGLIPGLNFPPPSSGGGEPSGGGLGGGGGGGWGN